MNALGLLLAFAGLSTIFTTAAQARARHTTAIATSQAVVTGTPLATVPQSFMGLSMNDDEMEDFTNQPAFPAFVSLLTPNGDGPFVLRVGGTEGDDAYWNGEEAHVLAPYRAPAADTVGLNQSWLDSLANVVHQTGSDVILGVNAAAHYPHMGLDLVRAAEQTLPAGSLMAASIGNEPNLYPEDYDGINAPWTHNFTASRYDTLYSLYGAAFGMYLPGVTLAGPEVSVPSATWIQSLINSQRSDLGLVTAHYYAYTACAKPGSAQYPVVYKYYRASVISQQTQSLLPSIEAAHAAGLPFRLTELGSSTCLGIPAVTDTFATSLWGLDEMFELLQSGVSGVNVHLRAMQPNSALHASAAGITAQPLMYGLTAFASMLGPGAQLYNVEGQLPSDVRVWAVDSGNGWRVALINDTTQRERIRLVMPANAPMTAKALFASSPWSQATTFGGQTISSAGTWQGPSETTTFTPVTGSYDITLAPSSATIGYIG